MAFGASVGESVDASTDGSKRQLAQAVHQLISIMNLTDMTLVGHDIGGMVTYAYLRAYTAIQRAVIMDVVIPGGSPGKRLCVIRTSGISLSTRCQIYRRCLSRVISAPISTSSTMRCPKPMGK